MKANREVKKPNKTSPIAAAPVRFPANRFSFCFSQLAVEDIEALSHRLAIDHHVIDSPVIHAHRVADCL